MSITIGISKGHGSPKYENYWRWLRSYDPDVRILDLYLSENLEEDLGLIDLLVLTGGGDINPAMYGHPEFSDVCKSIDDKRDAIETKMLAYAFDRKIPVLGICRGLQMINVFREGTLIPHVPAAVGGEQHSEGEEGDRAHPAAIEPGSLLYRTVNEDHATVNSSHHQGIGTLGKGLAAAATAPDGIIEAIEWREPEQQSFMMAVQWHPERMAPENPLSRNLLERVFLEAESARIFKATRPPLPKEEPEEIEARGPEEDKGPDPLLPIIQ